MKVIGLMSGTSADGVDAALCEITGEPPNLQVQVIATLMRHYPLALQQRILSACLPEHGRVDELCQLNVDLGSYFASVALQVIEQAKLHPVDIDLIGSHGQTVWHNILPDGRASSTLQLTEAAVIAERTGITTINNFRPRDITAGGQGAPLTAYVDWLLLRHPDHWRAIQNIGGMGNVTFLPPLSDTDSLPLAFDNGPGNALIDSVMAIATNGKTTFDRDGKIAASGQVDEIWLEKLLAHPYFDREPPKTTGRELFGTDMAQSLLISADKRGLRLEDLIATVTMLTAVSIADSYRRFAPAPITEVILGGGGRCNISLVKMLRDLLATATIMTHEDIGLDSDNKEALVFAILAHETWHARPGNHPALTGATHPVVLGQITPGHNYVELAKQTWGSS